MASVACRLTNIRIVNKVIRATNQILGNRVLEKALLARVVPSIVLFAGIHYKGIEDGPDLKFALNIGSAGSWGNFLNDTGKEPSEEKQQLAKWRSLMNQLGIYGCDDFEALLVEFFGTGMFDVSRLVSIIDKYVLERRNLEAREEANRFLIMVYWDHFIDNVQLLHFAAHLPDIASLLDPFTCTELNAALIGIPDGAPIGQAIVDRWVAEFRQQAHERGVPDNPFNRPLHPAIAEEFATASDRVQARETVLDACMHVIQQRGWGAVQEVALRRATAADFESAIRTMDIDKLRRFLPGMIEMRINKQTYDLHFGSATACFVEACQRISNDPASSRLGGLIKRLFADTALASDLLPAQPEATQIAAQDVPTAP